MPAGAVVLTVCSGAPDVVKPGKTLTLTVLESPVEVPALPEKVGVACLVELHSVGAVIDTMVVATLNVFGVVTVVLPAASDCCASAVYVPPGSEADAGIDQEPPEAAVVSVWMGLVAVPIPENSLTVIAGRSPAAVLAVPEKVGVALVDEEQFTGAVILGAGATVSTVNVWALLRPVTPAASDCDARAV